jgi:hypothetical protein
MKPVIPDHSSVEKPILFRRCSAARPLIASVVPVSSTGADTRIGRLASNAVGFSTIPSCYYHY